MGGLPLFTEPSMLHGAELLPRFKELGEVTQAERVRGCGYASRGKDGWGLLNMTAFYEALLGKNGLSDSFSGSGARTTRRPTSGHGSACSCCSGNRASRSRCRHAGNAQWSLRQGPGA